MNLNKLISPSGTPAALESSIELRVAHPNQTALYHSLIDDFKQLKNNPSSMSESLETYTLVFDPQASSAGTDGPIFSSLDYTFAS
jgi:hypothetical protein